MMINGRELEFIEDGHIYLVDGVIVPSITEILRVRFGDKYSNINAKTLAKAALRGTQIHAEIESLVKNGEAADIDEVRGFRFLQSHYDFTVCGSEIPVVLFEDDIPVGAGRLDLVLKIGDQIGGADIKTTSTLDKDYLFYQLNLYRIAYRQSYGIEWTFLRGIHLRGDRRKFVEIPISDEPMDLVTEYERTHE